MEYKVCKLRFKTGVHLGKGRLTDAECTLHADTLFSALCIEAIRSGGEVKLKSLVNDAKQDKIKISNGFPYIGKTLFLPKPMIPLEKKEDQEENKKEYKKLQYISAKNFSVYLAGNLNPTKEREQLKYLGKEAFQDKVAIMDRVESEPYHIGVYYFYSNAGLYFLIGFENEKIWKEVEELLNIVGIEGIGGRRSSGLGKFEIEEDVIPNELKLYLKDPEKMTNKMSLSLCLPREDELEKSMEGASYLIERRSGFVASENYANTWRKKRDLFCFQAGSVFKNTFSGDVYDVAMNGNHSVYRYAKPFFMGVSL